MSPGGAFETGAFTEAERRRMVNEVRAYLPQYLRGSAVERSQPVTDLEAITGLGPKDLGRLVSVHVCLSKEASRFVAALKAGLRHPAAVTSTREEISQSVRGPVDWAATTRARSAAGNDPATYVVRPGSRDYGTPENRALVWALDELDRRAKQALASNREATSGGTMWGDRLHAQRAALRGASQTAWLQMIEAAKPTRRVLDRVKRVRHGFYRRELHDVLGLLLKAESADDRVLTEIVCERYFEPERASDLFELVIALRLVHAVERKLGQPRRRRLLVGGSGPAAYASFVLDNGDHLELIAQRWPDGTPPLERSLLSERHGFRIARSRPDFCVERTGTVSDCVVLELKASQQRSELAKGLNELLAYLGDRPEVWGPAPAGWLVAPASHAFTVGRADTASPLWIATADEVADAVVARMLPST